MSRDTTDIANELLAENAALKGQLAQRAAQIARMEVELSGADERSKMMFEAKNHWADRARKAETQIVRLTTERDALREEKIGKNSNTRDAADIYFQLIEECEIPSGGSLVQYVDGLKEQIAALQENLNSCLITVAKYSGPDNTGNIDNTAQQYEALAGWKMVPVEPSKEMLSQIHPIADGNCSHCGNRTTLDCEENMLLSWRDMLAAAPKPEGKC